MSKRKHVPGTQPHLVKIEAEQRLEALDGIRERMKREVLSSLEQYIMQKAIALFLLGERTVWGALHLRVAVDGIAELPSLALSKEENEDKVVQAMLSLEQKGLLHVENTEEAIVRIASIVEGHSALVRSVFHYERKHRQE